MPGISRVSQHLPPSSVRLSPYDACMKNRVRLNQILADGVVHGDAAELLPELPAGSVDLFFTSPPYAGVEEQD